MGTLDLRNKLIDIINSSDERFLRMVNALHKSYYEKQEGDFFTESPSEIQEILLESRAQAQMGNVRSHKEVMAEFRQKYNISNPT
ncbi:hypothetical protein [Aquimarina rhabdastrellae]